MADNTTLNLGAGGDVIGSDDISGVKYQRVKVILGGDGVNDGDVSSSNPVPTSEIRPSTSSVTSVSSSGTSVSILASNSSRRGATFYNDVDKPCYLKFGATASTSSFTVKIFSNGFFSMPFPVYTGAIDAIWDSSPTGSLRITEF